MFKQKISAQDSGFSLVEVLVALLLTTFFVSTTMQAVVIATLFRVKSQENSQATNWIEEDLERVKYEANNLQLIQSQLASAISSTNTSIDIKISSDTANPTIRNLQLTNFTAGSKLRIGSDITFYTIGSVTDFGNTRRLNLTPKLAKDQAVNAPVVSLKMCSPTNADEGFAKYLKDEIPPVPKNVADNVGETDIKGKKFVLTRTTNISNTSPFNVLQVKYDVSPKRLNEAEVQQGSVAKFYLEVIPNVAFQCP